MRYLFEDYALDTDRRELCRGAEAVSVEPQVFDLLVYLIRNRERVVSKDDLLASVWHGRLVSESTLHTRISAARFAIGDNGEDQRLIKTLPRKGIRFVGAVRENRTPAAVLRGQPDAGALAQQADAGGLAVRPPERSQAIAIDAGVWHTALRAFQSQELRLWGVAAAALFCIALAAAYLIGRAPAPAVNPAHIGLAADRPVPLRPRPIFKDCDMCPDMVALPAGAFMMGSPEDDDLRLEVEGPPRRVAIARPFAIGRFEITVDQFAAFVAETATAVSKPHNECRVNVGFDLDPPFLTGSPDASFRRPGFEVTGSHPAGCISWYDAQAYLAWLRRKTGKSYRLPTEVEWEYAARAGTTTRYSFGMDERSLCDHARFADLASRYARRDGCRSDITTDGPIQVGKLKPNAWGIFDVHGNVSEWAEDCWTSNWSEIPTDGSAFARPSNCEMGVIRGGSWLANSRWVRTAVRIARRTPAQFQYIGFRVALTLDPP